MNDMGKLAILIPCYNEAVAIGQVVADFRDALPQADIFVYDNNSSDDTRQRAETAGAIVRQEPLQGKGHVVRRMFSDIEADCYILVDGDGTYDAAAAPEMVRALYDRQLDMVVGVRRHGSNDTAYRSGHEWGNQAFNALFSFCFSDMFTDILSGYRCFSRRFVKSFPSLSSGFEIETEISIHAYNLSLPVAEVETTYKSRPEGSHSKLNTLRDGLRILLTITKLYKDIMPLRFFSGISLVGVIIALALGLPLLAEFARTGLVPRFPTAILASAIMTLSGVSLVCGLILESVTRGRLEQKRLWYLSLPTPARRE